MFLLLYTATTELRRHKSRFLETTLRGSCKLYYPNKTSVKGPDFETASSIQSRELKRPDFSRRLSNFWATNILLIRPARRFNHRQYRRSLMKPQTQLQTFSHEEPVNQFDEKSCSVWIKTSPWCKQNLRLISTNSQFSQTSNYWFCNWFYRLFLLFNNNMKWFSGCSIH